jgi:hypothetical protein
MTGASIEATFEFWASSLRDVKARMRPLFIQNRGETGNFSGVRRFAAGQFGLNIGSTFGSGCRNGARVPVPVNTNLLPTRVAKVVPALNRDRPFHRHRFVSDQNDVDGLLGLSCRCSTPREVTGLELPQHSRLHRRPL